MPDTVSIIRLEGESLSVEAEKKRHSDWARQEAQILMDELFIELHQSEQADSDRDQSMPMDVDWVEGHVLESIQQSNDTSGRLVHGWPSLHLSDSHSLDPEEPWVSQPNTPPFYHRMLLVLGGLAIVTPLSLWGGTVLKTAQSKSVIAATPLPILTAPSVADKDFANYAEKALQKIEVKSEPADQAVGITALPTMKIGQTPSALVSVPPVPESVAMASDSTEQTMSQGQNASAASAPTASPQEINRLALRVFQPDAPIQSAVPPLSSAQPVPTDRTMVQNEALPELQSLSSITPAPIADMPSLGSTNAPSSTIAAATPMSSPADASNKVIGIVELGLQSTLMVSNNGSHLNFQVGDTVNEAGWQLVQIAQGKAILQKGTEYKSLSEGQYF